MHGEMLRRLHLKDMEKKKEEAVVAAAVSTCDTLRIH